MDVSWKEKKNACIIIYEQNACTCTFSVVQSKQSKMHVYICLNICTITKIGG